MRLFNPSVIRKAAEVADDPRTKFRLLALVGEEGSFQMLDVPKTINRRVERRPSASSRNAARLRSEHKNELRAFEQERVMLKREQTKHLKAKLELRRAQLMKIGSGWNDTGVKPKPPPPPRGLASPNASTTDF